MGFSDELDSGAGDFFAGSYQITSGNVIPDVSDIQLGKLGREMELAVLFIDIRESTKITDGFRRVTAARMYKSFLWGVARIARACDGQLRSFNGDGVLVVFSGGSRRTNAVKAALQMAWFCSNVLKPRLERFFENNNQLKDLEFDYGIGIDVGKVLIVRGGIRGENNNDLVWVGNATNYAVKLSALASGNFHVYISEDVYKNMDSSSRLGGKLKQDMWESRLWTSMNNRKIYRSNWTWKPG